MNISDQGLDLIKSSEGCELTAYADSAGVPTIGYGHTLGVHLGDFCTQEEADAWLLSDLETVQKCIANSVSVELTQGQFDALASFVFNLGCMVLRNSTLLRKLNDGDDVGASEEFLKWNHAGGQVLAGLTERRQKEEQLFMT